MATPGHVTRRRFTRVGVLGMAGLSVAAGARDDRSSDTGIPSSAPLMHLELRLRPDARGARRAAVVSGGHFRGSQVEGRVRDGGAWFVTRPDGSTEVNLQATLRTGDGETLSVRSRGLVEAASPAGQRLRMTPVFETGSPRYAWLNRLVTVGVGYLRNDRARLEVYAIS